MDKSKLHLTAADDGLELSREEFADADFQEPWRYERVNGRLVVMSPANYGHHVVVEHFRNHLGSYKLSHLDIVENVFQDSWAIIDDGTERIPDIEVYLTTNDDPRPFPDKVADLVFEIVSQTARDRRRDYEEKRAEFERIGVAEYVIVDRFDHQVLVLRLEDGAYAETRLGPDDVYTSPALPGLEIPLTGVI